MGVEMTWLRHFLGLDSPDGDWYLFWSGFGADLGMFGMAVTFWRRHVCHVPRCFRFTRHNKPTCRQHHVD
jgi:hypothetical protein